VCDSSAETSRKFRKQILDQCQQEFQKSNTDEDKIKVLEEQLAETTENDKRVEIEAELEDSRFQMRRRSLGNVRFIGELYKLQMLTPKIMVECVNMLICE
jgi:translation initiation factor 4G